MTTVTTEEFDRRGDPWLRITAVEALANHLGLASTADLRIVMDEMLSWAESGAMSDSDVRKLADATDMLQRLDALDRPWVYGNRYMSHRFVSTDPMCPACKNGVPHRTLLVCPTCNCPGPWVMLERHLDSSYAHYALVEQVRQLVNNELMVPGGLYRADGMTTAIPRGGAKSTWLCEIVSQWLLLTRRSRCLLILSNTIAQVTERAVEIKDELETNDLIIRDFGIQAAKRQDRRIWTQEDFVLANEGRCVARGAMQSMRGVKNKQYRPDVVISDDSDDEKFMTTSDQARKLLDWWDTRVVPACHPNALFMLHGTVLGEQALLWQQIVGNRGTTSARLVIQALQDDPGCSVCGMPSSRIGPFNCPVCVKVTMATAPRSFWGARFTVKALEAIRRKIGHWAWKSEFQQEAHDDSTSWFEKEWLDNAISMGSKLGWLDEARRKIIPWSIIACTLNGEEAVDLACQLDPSYRSMDGELGPYQLILHSWDPAWARAKPKDQKSCWMAGMALGLTWDDRIDVFWMDRARGLPSNSDYRNWMHQSWTKCARPSSGAERQGQTGMIVERNGGGVIFQNDVEEHWGSVPVLDHQTGSEKHSLEDGIPGMASWLKDGRVVIRGINARWTRGVNQGEPGFAWVDPKPNEPGFMTQAELADELAYELKMSGRSSSTDMLMTLWFGWAYFNRWIRDVRDPERYNELVRRSARSFTTSRR